MVTTTFALLAALLAGSAAVTQVFARRITRRFPPVGDFVEAGGARLHRLHLKAPPGADLPALVFIHGASGNLRDPLIPMRAAFGGRAEMLFFDRPGHGWSARGREAGIDGQADQLAALMTASGIGRAIVVAHSFGGAVAAALALRHPGRVAGLVFLAAASHPWPGGRTAWYYSLTATALVGPLFARTLALPAGLARLDGAIDCVFSPNPVPRGYAEATAIALVLRPQAFLANARDVEGLFAHAAAAAPRYGTIAAPTVVITGDRDTVVFEEVHSHGLARDIPGARLVSVHNLGHKPEWVAPELVVAAVETVAGRTSDLEAVRRAVEARIAGDAHAVARCPDPKLPAAAVEP